MEHWTGIQPKANNHQKNLTNKQPIGRSKQANPNLTKNMTDNAINEVRNNWELQGKQW